MLFRRKVAELFTDLTRSCNINLLEKRQFKKRRFCLKMGNGNSGCLDFFDVPNYIISIKTGDTKGAGLHSKAEVTLINDERKEKKQIQLSGCCVTVFKKGRINSFNIYKMKDFGTINRIIVEKNKEQNDVEWYVERITVRHIDEETEYETIFPINRWLRNRPLVVSEFDICLPQHESSSKQRSSELNIKRVLYGYQKSNHRPPQLRSMPRDEVFSNFYKWDIMQKRSETFRVYQIPEYQKPKNWSNFDEIESLFKERGKFRRPSALDKDWKSDQHFGAQRLAGCNSRSLKLCKEIPENFAVTNESVEDFLEGFSLNEAIKNKKLFIVNHSLLNGLLNGEHQQLIPSPMALFYLNKEDILLPIAIQLYQEKSDANPLFLPSDPYYTWLLAKMWFNNADAVYQRACLLSTSNHWVLELITIAMNRQLSPSHPIYRLLAPYLRLVLAVNHFEMFPLLSPGGWVDNNTTLTAEATFQLINKFWEKYNFEEFTCLKMEMEKNDILDAEVITEYPYRDDGLILYECINGFVSQIVSGFYETENILQDDTEIQGMAAELVGKDFCEFKNVPGNGKFETRLDLIKFLTYVIYKSTVEHASLNLPLYDECAFVPNYPLMLRGKPPTNKDALTESDIMQVLPPKHVTMEIIVITKLLSERDTSGLADSKAQYLYDPISKPARERFLGALRETAAVITVRNRKRRIYYDYLNPASKRGSMIALKN